MSFALDLRKIMKKHQEKADLIVQKIVMDVGARLVEKSPVGNPELWASLHPHTDLATGKVVHGKAPAGYVGGRFRGNWQYGFGTLPSGTLDVVDASGKKSNSRIEAGVMGNKAAGIHYLTNNLPYAQRLEDGWSRQAPSGMVGLTVIEFNQVVRKIVAATK